MEKKELEKAIEKGESVWAYDDLLHRVIPYKANEIAITGINTNMPAYELKDLFATKQQAEHYLHHANVERVETLPFLTWEEFKIKKSLRFKRANDFIFCEMSIFKNQIYIVGHIEKFECFGEATEENFYKAYDECVRLFREQ